MSQQIDGYMGIFIEGNTDNMTDYKIGYMDGYKKYHVCVCVCIRVHVRMCVYILM